MQYILIYKNRQFYKYFYPRWKGVTTKYTNPNIFCLKIFIAFFQTLCISTVDSSSCIKLQSVKFKLETPLLQYYIYKFIIIFYMHFTELYRINICNLISMTVQRRTNFFLNKCLLFQGLILELQFITDILAFKHRYLFSNFHLLLPFCGVTDV